MITLAHMNNKTAAVLGLGQSGMSVCRALLMSGARVWAWDDDLERRIEASAAGIAIVDLDICNWSRVEGLYVSPGIPLRHPRPHRLIKRARAAGVPVAGDMELLAKGEPERLIVGVTGTNGKSTTSSLIATLLRQAGIGTQLGGNIGLPVLDLLPKPAEDIYVLELSSYQLDLTERLKCAVAVILNLSPDHLERHGGIVGYSLAKKRILRNQGAGDWAVIGVDDEHGAQLCEELVRQHDRHVMPIATNKEVEQGVYVINGRLIDALDGHAKEVMDLSGIESLRGVHNWQNAAAAYGAVRALGVAADRAVPGLAGFKGLAHRMELVGELGQVRFINDSKATNPVAAATALACYDVIYWIAGGRPKQADLEPVLPWLDRVRQVYLIGEAAPMFAELLADKVPVVQSGDLESAIDAAARDAAGAGGRANVLLAPACASFDQFRNFEERGDAFRHLVANLMDEQKKPLRAVGGGGG